MWMRARWFPYALIGLTVVVSGAFGWGYMKGWRASTEKAVEEERARMQAVMDFRQIRMEQENRALRSLLDDERRASEISNMEHVGNLGCDVEPDRLRDLQSAVRSANSIAGANETTAPNEATDQP